MIYIIGVIAVVVVVAIAFDEPRVREGRQAIADSYEYERLYREAEAGGYYDGSASGWRYPVGIPSGHNPVCSCGCSREQRWPHVAEGPIYFWPGPWAYNELVDA